MAKTITLTTNLHLSEKFGGIKHGEDVGDYKKGATLEVKSDALADHLIKKGWATELVVSKSEPKK